MKRLVTFLLSSVVVVACGSTDASDGSLIGGSSVCKVERLGGSTTEFQVEEAVQSCIQGGPAPPKEPPVLNAKRECDRKRFLSPQAATCLAAENSFPPGIEPWRLALSFDSRLQKVVWNVLNVVSREDAANWNGQSLVLDAMTGNVLELLQVSSQS